MGTWPHMWSQFTVNVAVISHKVLFLTNLLHERLFNVFTHSYRYLWMILQENVSHFTVYTPKPLPSQYCSLCIAIYPLAFRFMRLAIVTLNLMFRLASSQPPSGMHNSCLWNHKQMCWEIVLTAACWSAFMVLDLFCKNMPNLESLSLKSWWWICKLMFSLQFGLVDCHYE